MRILLILCLFLQLSITRSYSDDYGIRITNDASQLQIDSLYVNYALWEHGESASTSLVSGGYLATIIFDTVSAEPPLIAIKPGGSYCGLGWHTKSGSDYTGFTVFSGLAMATFDWQAFVPRKDASAETCGLRVYNASGVLVFDSGHSPMIISDIDTCSPAYNSTVAVTHPSDSDAYFIMAPHGDWLNIGGWNGYYSHFWRYFPQLKYDSATQITFGGVKVVDSILPADITFSDGYWPSTWTIITVKKVF